MTAPLSSLTNHQVRLARRPVGLPTATTGNSPTEPVAEPGRRRRAGQDPGAVARPRHARLDERGQELHPAGGHRRGHARRRRGRGHRVAATRPSPWATTSAAGSGVQEYFTVAADQLKRSGLAKIDLRLGTLTQWLNVLGMPGMTGYFGLHGRGPAAGRRDGRRLGRGRRRRADRGPARQDQGLPRRRHRRRRRPSASGWCKRTRLRRLHRLQGRPQAPVRDGPEGSTARRASTSTSTTSAATSSTPCSRASTARRASSSAAPSASTTTPPRCRARRTTCRCW